MASQDIFVAIVTALTILSSESSEDKINNMDWMQKF